MKQCTKCQRHLPLSKFGSKKHTRVDGNISYYKRSKCRECINTDNLERYRTRPSTKQAHLNASYRHRIKSYGLTIEEFEELLEQQDGKCAVCGEQPDKRLHIDHCHTTGKIRALLCNGCNAALGLTKENIETLKKLIAYLEQHNG